MGRILRRVCILPVSLFLFSNVPIASAQTYNFGQAVFPTGKQPQAIATADLNGDGLLDFVVANQSDNTVSIYLGQPDGTFKQFGGLTGLLYPGWVIIADFNGDGIPDIAVAEEDCLLAVHVDAFGCGDTPSISIFLGNGDGTFQAGQDLPTPTQPRCVQAADLNGDGKLDLVVASNLAGSMLNTNVAVSVFLGNGDGTFQPRVDYATPAGQSNLGFGGPAWVVVADFNGDGRLDVASNNGAQAVSIFLGNGDGTLQSPTSFPLPAQTVYGNYAGAVAGDFNGDGKQDLAITTNFSLSTTSPNPVGLVMCLGKGDGTFTVLDPVGIGFDAVIAADVNKDGKLDLVFPNEVGGVSVALGNGDGTFPQVLGLFTSPGATGAAVGDFNGDGQLDIAVTATNVPDVDRCPGCTTIPGSLTVFLGEANPIFGPRTTLSNVGVANSFPVSILPVDLNGDGKLDLVFTNSGQSGSSLDNTISVLLGNGDGTFQPERTFPTGIFPVDVETGDFNGDGKPDLAVANQICALTAASCGTGSVSVLLGNGDGSFQPRVDYPVGVTPLSVAIADFNGDGKPDLAVANYGLFQGITFEGTVGASVLINQGNGTFSPHVDYALPGPPNAIAAGDFNDDGRPDIAVSTLSPDNQGSVGPFLSVLPGKGDGTFLAPVETGIAVTGRGLAGMLVPVGDLGNGHANLLGAHVDNGAYSIFYGIGGGKFFEFQAPGVQPQSGFLATGDFNGDGNLDFAVVEPSGTISIFQGDGQTDFTQAQQFFPPVGLYLNYRILAAGDFNGDGALDVAVVEPSSTSNGIVAIVFNDPFKAVYPNHIAFGLQGVTTSSAVHTVTLSNIGVPAFTISSVTVSGPFSETNNCVTKLLRTQNCTINVSFLPVASGASNGSITLTDSTHSSPQVISLTGTGINGPFLQLSPGRLMFAATAVGSTSAPQAVTLANVGNTPLAITNIGIPGGAGFLETNTCGSSLAAGATCSVNVTFAPTAGGPSTAVLTIADSGPGNRQTVNLSATGLISQPSLSATSLTFGAQQVGSTSAPQNVTLSNTGAAVLNITQISTSADFAETNNCGTSLTAGGTCQISVTFAPTANGARTGTLTVVDNASGGPQTVTLTGTGQPTPPAPAPVVGLSPMTVTFPAQYVGTSGLPKTVIVSNAGDATLAVTAVGSTAADFGVFNNCINTVAPGSSCNVAVFFDPTTGGTRSGALTITDNAGNSPQTVALTGNGQDFSVMPGSAASTTVTAGQTANYSIAVAPAGGFAANVALSCSGGPVGSACAVSPSTIALSGAAAQTAMVTVTTAAHGWLLPFRGGWPRDARYRQTPMILTLAAMFLLMVVASQFLRREQNLVWIRVVGFAALVTLGLTLTSCGGGSGSGGGGTNPQAGTYTINVTGNFTTGSTTLTHAAKLTLVVR
jgi:hypothetical protein